MRAQKKRSPPFRASDLKKKRSQPSQGPDLKKKRSPPGRAPDLKKKRSPPRISKKKRSQPDQGPDLKKKRSQPGRALDLKKKEVAALGQPAGAEFAATSFLFDEKRYRYLFSLRPAGPGIGAAWGQGQQAVDSSLLEVRPARRRTLIPAVE